MAALSLMLNVSHLQPIGAQAGVRSRTSHVPAVCASGLTALDLSNASVWQQSGPVDGSRTLNALPEAC